MESRRAGFDIGMDRATREWLHKHHTAWCRRPPSATDAPFGFLPGTSDFRLGP